MGVAPSYYCYGYCCFILVIVIVILCILLFWCVGMVLLLLLSILYISSPYMFGWVSCDALYIFLPHPPPFCVPGNRPRGRKGFGCVQIDSSKDCHSFAFVSVYLLEAE